MSFSDPQGSHGQACGNYTLPTSRLPPSTGYQVGYRATPDGPCSLCGAGELCWHVDHKKLVFSGRIGDTPSLTPQDLERGVKGEGNTGEKKSHYFTDSKTQRRKTQILPLKANLSGL